MTKHIQLLILVIVLTSISKAWGQEKINSDPKFKWTTLFKDFATYKCICEITKEEIVPLMMKHKDYSFVVHEELLSVFGDSADTAGRNFAKRIPFITSEKGSDLYGYKPAFSYCLMFARSPHLDSIANKQYNLFFKVSGARWLRDNQK